MTAIGLAQIAIVLVAVIAAALPLGAYIARVMGGERTAFTPALAPTSAASINTGDSQPRQPLAERVGCSNC